ncbi:RNA-binding domain-containing protein [Tractidigestivibacter scatoligenes]|jgi:ATP-dependent DNA helicase RecG|uniref:RNA-binding domain-containing protein n=1 Tax=Tractidigestivibacter scatoligenes TaxID=1299998 RepID=UPI002F357D02
MIRRIDEMPALILRLITDVETEVVEYKEAKQSYNFEDIGKYFSALSNEANLRSAECGWLLFGVSNDRRIAGTAYRKEAKAPSVGLRRLKHEVAKFTNGGVTFEEIYEVEVEGKRVVAFQIPPAAFATPTTWHGIPWSRENESLVEMPRFKLEAIYGQSRPDWSRQIAYEAREEDLDPDAVDFACKKYVEKFQESQPTVRNLGQADILKKIGLIIHGYVTNAALVLLGRPESCVFLGGVEPRISWTLYASDGSTIAYEHFEPPFITQVDSVLGKIRNEKYRFFDREDTLFPIEARRYSPEVIRELLHNCIAHQDYRLSGKINVLEYEDRLVFKNEGGFIPGTVEAALESGYKPPYYRNPLLSAAMGKTGMIDQNAIGIRNVFDIQKGRLLPMPTYDLSVPGRVSVTLYGTVLDENYSRLLAQDKHLDLGTVVLLDMVQKGIPITKEQSRALHERGLVRGRYPQLTISAGVAAATGTHGDYVRNKGIDNSVFKELILELLHVRPCSRSEIIAQLDHALPAEMTMKQKSAHVSYLLQSLRKEGKITNVGNTSSAEWRVAE